MVKNYGPKNPTLGCNLGPNKQPPWCPLVWKQNDDIAVQYKDVHGLLHATYIYMKKKFHLNSLCISIEKAV